MTQEIWPTYTSQLMTMFRAYMSMGLALRAGKWQSDEFRDFCEEKGITKTDEYQLNWFRERIVLMDETIGPMREVVFQKIIDESSNFFRVDRDKDGWLMTPHVIRSNFSDLPISSADADVASAISYQKARGLKIVNFESEEIFAYPQSIPSNVIEIWFPFIFSYGNYELFMKVNHDYGWDCFGHEM